MRLNVQEGMAGFQGLYIGRFGDARSQSPCGGGGDMPRTMGKWEGGSDWRVGRGDNPVHMSSKVIFQDPCGLGRGGGGGRRGIEELLGQVVKVGKYNRVQV